MKKSYYATVAGFIEGAHRNVGDEIRMTDRQAKYPLLSGLVTDQKPKPVDPLKRAEPNPATIERKTR